MTSYIITPSRRDLICYEVRPDDVREITYRDSILVGVDYIERSDLAAQIRIARREGYRIKRSA